MEKKCLGCGVKLQIDNENEVGFVPSHLLNKAKYCQRCFKLIHYGKFKDMSKSIDFDNIFQFIKSKNPLIIYLIDSFNIDGSLIDGFNKLFNDCKTLVIANKIDIWPKSMNKNKIYKFIINKLNKKNVKFDDIIGFSSFNSELINKTINKIKSYKNREVFVVGKINSGKSSFINSLIKHKNIDQSLIATSFYPSTTLDLIRVDFKDFYLTDSPGFIDDTNIYNYLNNKNLKKVINLKEVKPISMSLLNETLFIGSLMYISLENDIKARINIYGNSLIKYHKTKTFNLLEKFDSLTNNPLYVPKLNNIVNYEDIDIKLDGNRNMLFIGGLCNIDFLNVKGILHIHKIKDLSVELERSMLNDIK